MTSNPFKRVMTGLGVTARLVSWLGFRADISALAVPMMLFGFLFSNSKNSHQRQRNCHYKSVTYAQECLLTIPRVVQIKRLLALGRRPRGLGQSPNNECTEYQNCSSNELQFWYSHAESNRNRQNRNLKFYPLNYRSMGSQIQFGMTLRSATVVQR